MASENNRLLLLSSDRRRRYAEDVVQETFLRARDKRETFGWSRVRTTC